MSDSPTSKPQLDAHTERAVRRFLEVAQAQFHPKGAIVFGSRARGTHRVDSDADVALLLEGAHARMVPTKMAMANLAFDVLMETGLNISPLPVWMDQWEHPELFSNPSLLANIAREGIWL
ncbi:nucleotidyltransferase domain-containing protein [Rhodoferax sp. OV413]|uniref:nucleotidyltransferase domain-containing protein n=1 Tax=Rhodoferax sp. OV413 TaxID=1855285 RepID=UPI0025EBB0BE|nr:nucleotidyltransferase domain-containing protein [Rhodoferax sp. OV413]